MRKRLILPVTLIGLLLPAVPAHAAPPPSVVSFTPAVVTAGTPVTAVVANLDPSAVTSTVTVNGVAATVTARTTTGVTFTAPADTSGGRLSITAAAGTATSTDDLAITPPGTSAGEISGAARIVVGDKTTVSVPAGKTALRLFDATAAERFTVTATGGTAAGCWFGLRLYDSRNGQAGSACAGYTGWLDTTAASVAGTRTLAVQNNASSTAPIDLVITRVPADANLGTLALDGTGQTVSIDNPGQNGYLSFAGTAGQRVSLQTTNASSLISCCWRLAWGVHQPDGTRVGPLTTGNATLDPITLPVTGTYQVRLDPLEERTGSITVAARAVPTDINLGTLALDGTGRTVTIDNAGQNAYFSFSGTANQRVAVQTSGASTSFACCGRVWWGIYGPTGSLIGHQRSGNDFLDALKLPVTGVYQLVVDPSENQTGSLTVAAFNVPADADLGALALDGSARTVTVSNQGQDGFLSFAGTAGQRVAVQATALSAGLAPAYLEWGLWSPAGAQLSGATRYGNGFVDLVLPTTGTYQLRLNPAEHRTGSVTLTGWAVPADANLGTLTLDGVPKTATIANAGQAGYLTFTGTAGQTVTITSSAASTGFGCCYVAWSVKRPDGTTAGTRTGNSSLSVPLTATGTYQLVVDPDDERTGSLTFAATTAPTS